MTTTKPLPRITPDSAPFWAAAAAGRFELPFCRDCARAHLPPGPVCPHCFSDRLEWRAASGRGRVATCTIVHKAWFEAFAAEVPYNVAQVELDAGILERFDKAQAEMSDLEFQSARGSFSGDPADDPELYAAFGEVSRKHGFKSFEEVANVGRTISLVMTGLDPATGDFSEPVDALKAALERARSDPALQEAQRQQVIAEIEALLPTVPKLEHKGNVEVVKAFLARSAPATE